METFVSGILTVIAALLAIPVTVFCLEIVAAISLPRKSLALASRPGSRRRLAVLLPAHNESTGLVPTLADVKAQLQAGQRVLVVADNCTDDTAVVASLAGAEVIQRHDPAAIGKGYALDFGIRHLATDPPEIVIIIDADCRLADHAIELLATACEGSGRPVQATYLMTARDSSMVNQQVAEFAWRVKNWIRPLGLHALGLPSQLYGTGMAIPWDVICSVDLANGSIVEDLKLGLDLAQAGHPALFCPSARVTSEFASSAQGAGTQRTRWEQGHIQTIFSAVPRLFWRAFAQRNWRLLALTLDLAVPPLSLLVMLVSGIFLLSTVLWLFGWSSAAMPISAIAISAMLLSTLLAWVNCGRSVLPIGATLSIAPYALGKTSLYWRILSRRVDARWIKTDRTITRQKPGES